MLKNKDTYHQKVKFKEAMLDHFEKILSKKRVHKRA